MKKMYRGSEQTFFFLKKHTNGQQVPEKVLNTINHQGNTNQNFSGLLSHTY